MNESVSSLAVRLFQTLMDGVSAEWWKEDIERKYEIILAAGESFKHINLTGDSMV